MINWQRKLLKEVVLYWSRGATPSRSHKEYYAASSDFPWVRASDLKGGILTEAELYLTPEGADQIKGQAPKGAVLLSVSGTIGKVAIAGRDLKTNQAVLSMVFDETKVLTKYAYYYFQYYRPWLEAKANTVTIPNLTRTQLENTYILFPCLEEQKYIVDLMMRAEGLSRKNQNTLAAIEQILYSAMYKQLQYLSGERKEQQLRDYLREPVLQGIVSSKKEESNCCCINSFHGKGWAVNVNEDDAAFCESGADLRQYALKQGDILIRRYRLDSESGCLLAAEDLDDVIFGRNFFRIRIREDKLRPEFLVVWLYYYFTYYNTIQDNAKAVWNQSSFSDIPIPPVPLEVQDKFVEIVRKALKIQDKMAEMEKKTGRFYQALLASALTSDLSKNYRSRHQLEEPELSFIGRHYQAAGLEHIKDSGFAANLKWETLFNNRERKMIEYLSEFQKDVLHKYVEMKEPAPIHVIFKKIREEHKSYDRSYSIQDAIAAVKILEGWGFLNSTLPEKIYFGEEAITDLHGGSITIQKYQIPLND
ncbi:MAG: hypothetical protein HDR71_01915 [Lachnospiraceae bacterium]|nr:hypothetical protein [Lachnospiraceae bacterium]